MDAELIQLARGAIADRYGLTSAQGARLRGDTAKELIADAKEMRTELGLDPLPEDDGQERDERGRYTNADGKPDVNKLIRAATGR